MQCPDCLDYRHEGACPPARSTGFPLPCPFCGTEPGLASPRIINSTTTIYLVGCEDDECVCNPQVSAFTQEDAWKRWNTRVGK